MFQFKWFRFVFFFVFFVGVIVASFSFATEEKMTVAITPPVFQVNLSHGDVWKSTVKIINLNPYSLFVRVSVADMKKGGSGFETPVDSMERWVDVPRQVLFLGAEKSIDVPFSVSVPHDAPPGGHYAFILVGIETEDGKSKEGGGVSSYVSSSLFVRVGGDIHEEGDFREFSTEKMFYEKADVSFRIRFENTGNVHLRPYGIITIYDVWGKKRVELPVNEGGGARILFPHTLQIFSPRWVSDQGVLETGFYRAEAQLRFGDNDARVVRQALYFFVIPFKELIIGTSVLLIVLLFIGYVIRMYIRWMLTLEYRRLGLHTDAKNEKTNMFLTPLTEGVVDLRTMYTATRNGHLFSKKFVTILLGIFFIIAILYLLLNTNK